VPWAYDEEAVDVLRYFTKLKATLMPYLYRNAIETSKTGVPVMRSMALEFTGDRNCAYIATQYMFGDSLLVAPIFNDRSMAEYYLPEGRWTSLLTGEVKEGGKWYREKHSYLSIPLYAREGSIVAIGACDDNAVYDYAKNVTYKVFALADGKQAHTVVYSPENELESELTVTREGSTYRISLTSAKSADVLLVNEKAVVSADGAEYEVTEDGVRVHMDGSGVCTVNVR
jgi:alpha-D-xyloside xylohydrolase